MNNKFAPDFAPGSRPDITTRVRHAMEANETTRIVLSDGLAALAKALDLHLSQIDTHLSRLIADLEARSE